MLSHTQLRARVAKVTRADVPPGQTLQNCVNKNLCRLGLVMLNDRHLDGEAPLDSGNSHDVETLAEWLMVVADKDYAADFTDDTEGVQAKFRLSRGLLETGARDRACWIIGTWDPTKVEGRRRGGRHRSANGTTKGPPPRWSAGDLLPYWHLPARGRAKAVAEGTGMSPSTYYKLAKDVPALLARKEREHGATDALRPAFDQLLDP